MANSNRETNHWADDIVDGYRIVQKKGIKTWRADCYAAYTLARARSPQDMDGWVATKSLKKTRADIPLNTTIK